MALIPPGEALALLSALCFACSNVFVSKGPQESADKNPASECVWRRGWPKPGRHWWGFQRVTPPAMRLVLIQCASDRRHLFRSVGHQNSWEQVVVQKQDKNEVDEYQ